MPQYRYDGFADTFKLNEDDPGTKQGAIGTFSKATVDKYTAQGHMFTPVDELRPAAVTEAKEVAKEEVKK